MIKEFKEFALKGNVMELAVGVIIGGAFGKIVTSLVNDMIMPILSILTGGVNFSDLKIVLHPATKKAAEVALHYGAFLQSMIDFFIIAFAIFLFMKAFNSVRRGKGESEEKISSSKDVELLTEIRDLLKEQKTK